MARLTGGLLYVPNEHNEGDQRGPRAVFADSLARGEIESYVAYPLEVRLREHGREAGKRRLIELAREMQPSVVMLQHLAGTGFLLTDWKRLRDIVPKATLAYHEHDPYTPIRHPLPAEARAAAQIADVIFTPGTGQFRKNFVDHGALDVRYSPHGFDEHRFSRLPARFPRSRKVVMIANAHRPRKPWRLLPGAQERKALVKEASKLLGSRFEVFGRGWKGPTARGFRSYDSQAQILAEAAVSINWDHFPREPHYFSDRWPISLASGAVHITTEHPGQEDLTEGDDRILSAVSVEELLTIVDNVLAKPDAALRGSVDAANEFAGARLKQATEFRRLLFEVGLIGEPPTESDWIYRSGLASLGPR